MKVQLSPFSDKPSLFGSEITYVLLGDPASIECSVMAFPEPKVAFWKGSSEHRIPIVDGGNYRVQHSDEPVIPFADVRGESGFSLAFLEATFSSHLI